MANEYNREQTIEAVIDHAKGHISKHKMNVEILMQRPAGIGEHGDVSVSYTHLTLPTKRIV